MRPSLNNLKTFAVVADVLSFTHAAQILHVTQGAVSQQIAKLEDGLGTTLFLRQGRTLKLTTQGLRLHRGVRTSLERVEAELDALVSHRSDEILALTTFGSFAAQWLMPRLPGFESKYPQVRLNIDTTLRVVSLAEEGFDLGIRFGRGEWPGLRAEKIFAHRIYPTAGAHYAATLDVADHPETLLDLPLYYDLETPTEWSRWFGQLGLPGREQRLMRGFSDTLVMLSALRNGLDGVALLGDHLTENEIKNGSLVRLHDHYIEPEGAYYLVYPQHLPLTDCAQVFRDWLLNEA
ncbi:MAG: LysR substrate-binding domain-containing protein [Pseudomonadota bacterium]